jgi:hypothetical protein
LAAPLHPADRNAFINSAVMMLSQEPTVGRGSVHRVVRDLLATGLYRVDVVAGAGRPRAGAHHGYDHAGRRGRHGKKPTDDAA